MILEVAMNVTLGMRVLSVDDIGFDNKGGSIYLAYQQQKEQLAGKSQGGTFAALGITAIP